MSKKKNTKNAAANESAAAVGRHQAELDRLKVAAETACEKDDDAWDAIVKTLTDNSNYIGALRSNLAEMNAAAKAAGVKLTAKRREKPSATFLHAIYPTKVRQRIHEWATALEIASKFGWKDAELGEALHKTPLKKFKKTYDPGSRIVATGAKKGRRDGALAVIKIDAACDFTGRVICYGDADGNGRIKIMKVASDAEADPKSPATAGNGGDHHHQTLKIDRESIFVSVLKAMIDGDVRVNYHSFATELNSRGFRTPHRKKWYRQALKNAISKLGYDSIDEFVRVYYDVDCTNDTDTPLTPEAAGAEFVNIGLRGYTSSIEYDIAVMVALRGIAGNRLLTVNAAVKALNSAGIAMANGRVWYSQALHKLVRRCGYETILDLLVDVGTTDDDDNPDPPPAASAPVPPESETSTNAKGGDVEAPPTTVSPAGNADAAVIVNDAGKINVRTMPASMDDTSGINATLTAASHPPDPHRSNLKLVVEEVDWEVLLALDGDQVVMLVETLPIRLTQTPTRYSIL